MPIDRYIPEWLRGPQIKQEVERPGEIYSTAHVELPALIRNLSAGILLVSAFRLPWVFVGVLGVMYLGVHALSKTFARYMDHGSKRIAYSMSACVWVLVAWLVVTLGGMGALEVGYQLKLDEERERQAEIAAHPAKVEQFKVDEKEREAGWKEREQARLERARVQLASNEQAARQARALVTLKRENKDARIATTAQAIGIESDAGEVFIPRMPPAEPEPIRETAQRFLVKWGLRLKIWQFGDFGVAMVGLILLLILRISLNEKGRQKLVNPEDRELLPLIVGDRATLSNLQEWRSPSLLPESLRNAVFESLDVDGESGEAVPECGMENPTSMETVERIQIDKFPSEGKKPVWNGPDPFECNSWPQGNGGHQLWNEVVESIKQKRDDLGDRFNVKSCEPNEGMDVQSSVESIHSIGGIVEVGEGNYKLYRKIREGELAGYDLRRVKTEKGQKKDVCFVNPEKFALLMSQSREEQEAQIERWIKDKEDKGNLRTFPQKKAARA